mmetsp:Transcript_103/g.149  ORF Transcript_103/g.149 Transcript_103/m.149 type:complete len:137 (+) Transcript_103:108-518(+)|eukprot:CAMPEP_0178424412 /NCGR_PEP_ID=MMETSP0689_2-20121128/28195_1 /TAXON_ID=160604 /ORGANISM="Amphidinium massartii, Strain CS-259" /LENGTH=136 /DNA_ID=CAMNT_0020046045 /DNA_START=51 /DNA_END=461 /DNA_ORIENTATION=-
MTRLVCVILCAVGLAGLQTTAASRPEVHSTGLIARHTAEVDETGPDDAFDGTKAKHPELATSVKQLQEATATAGQKAEEVAEKMEGYHEVIKQLGEVLPEASKQAKVLQESLWKELSDQEEQRTQSLKGSDKGTVP